MAPGTWGANRHFQGYRFLDKPLAPLLVPFDQIFFSVCRVIMLDFHCLGMKEKDIDWLQWNATGLQRNGAAIRRNQCGIPSKPAEVTSIVSKILNTSLTSTSSTNSENSFCIGFLGS